MNPTLPSNTDVIVPSNVLNNMARIIYQHTAITANQHRDLENMMSLLMDRAISIEKFDQRLSAAEAAIKQLQPVSPLETELRKYVSQDDIDKNRNILDDIERNGPKP